MSETTAPPLGAPVLYTLNDADCEAINRRREDYTKHRRIAGEATNSGHIGHVGNQAENGQTYPATVVRVFGGNAANLQVHLDGNDTYWATSRSEGDGEGHWVYAQPQVAETSAP